MPIHLYNIKDCEKLSKNGDYKRRLLCGTGIYSEQTPSLVIILNNLCIYTILLLLIRCTNKFPPFFYQKLGIYCERTEPYILFEALSIACHYFFLSFWQHTDTTSEEYFIFWGYPRIDPIFGIFIYYCGQKLRWILL